MEEERVAPEESSQSEEQQVVETCRKESEKEEGDDEAAANLTVTETTQQEIINTQNSKGPPLSDSPAEDQTTPPTENTEEATPENNPLEPCWYCLRSLDSQYRPQIPKQEDSSASVPSSGHQRVIYQTDPRPHFGVAWSSHAPRYPLWDSEGPCWGQRNQEMPNPTHTCPHCHLGLPADTLRWHEAKCLLFEELRAAKK